MNIIKDEKWRRYDRRIHIAVITDNSGNILDIKTKDWKLIILIDVATDIGIIPKQRADAVDQILRDFRNFIHPRKEVRSQFPCGEAEALLAKGALDAICNHLEKNV